MKKLWQSSPRARRRHAKLLAKIRKVEEDGYPFYLRGASSFRMAERLFRAGLVLVRVSKWNLFGGEYPFRELEVTTRRRWEP